MVQNKVNEEFLKNNFKVQKLCDTIDKNPTYLLTITENVD